MTNCQCNQPPGGGGQCGPNQVAMCEVRDGRCYTSCVHVPAAILADESPHRAANWLLSMWLPVENLGNPSPLLVLTFKFLPRANTTTRKQGGCAFRIAGETAKDMLRGLETGEEHGLAATT